MTTPSGNLILDDEYMTVRSISVSDMDNNVYLLTSKTTGQQVLIDAADNAPAIREFISTSADEDFTGDGAAAGLSAIFTTHGHWDHIRALKEIAEEFDVATFAGDDDLQAIEEQENFTVDTGVNGTEIFHFEDFSLETISLVGHTPGSIALVLRDIDEMHPTLIFTGDSLFPGGVGKTNSPEDFESLFEDVKTKIFDEFDDDTVVLPGHGNCTTLGADRGNLSEWKKRGW
ncbi:Zn-dependent hydrolase [Rothia aerolata]|uniref:Zn-dependent hydrolase n=1 Tax=Rothia aerolata TaxID=1812262 RepID=A0A917INK2_9MICC|nr:MBL fold metallo-hydrolase [Rothia aerolata]GGH57157.1 Zn-dependent hydrolase [Rothia aerolata]